MPISHKDWLKKKDQVMGTGPFGLDPSDAQLGSTYTLRRYDGYHGEAELGLPPGFLATRSGCNHPRSPNGCNLIWSSAAYDAGRKRLFTVSGNCDTDDDPATLQPPPPMPRRGDCASIDGRGLARSARGRHADLTSAPS
jgi:hypothetical protein